MNILLNYKNEIFKLDYLFLWTGAFDEKLYKLEILTTQCGKFEVGLLIFAAIFSLSKAKFANIAAPMVKNFNAAERKKSGENS